jgi:hypothetical protein
VLYLSALCDDAIQGKRLLNAAMNALLTFPDPVNSENSSTVQSETTEEKPTVIWSGLYMQEISTVLHILNFCLLLLASHVCTRAHICAHAHKWGVIRIRV